MYRVRVMASQIQDFPYTNPTTGGVEKLQISYRFQWGKPRAAFDPGNMVYKGKQNSLIYTAAA